MSGFMLGAKALKALVVSQDNLAYWKAKLSEPLFRGDEKAAFLFVQQYFEKFKALPQPETLLAQFPELGDLPANELPKYYVDKLESRYFYELINKANLDSQAILKEDQGAFDKAEKVLRDALQLIAAQRYRERVMNFGEEAADMLLAAYYKKGPYADFNPLMFGWPYMDDRTGGVLPGDVVSFVGRPAQGKTWFLLYIALFNWLHGRKILFVSMEMATLAISQRLGAMYAGTNVSQLKVSGYSTQTMMKFSAQIGKAKDEPGTMYIVDGNLAAAVDDLYALADQLDCEGILIDGAYLMRHRNPRLGRYEKVAENVELMKRFSVDMPTFASWQFNRQGAKKNKKAGEKETLEDIGYSDAIGQISSIVVGLMQEDSVETIEKRRADLLKGRNGEIGGWDINWNFNTMDFGQMGVNAEESHEKPMELEYL